MNEAAAAALALWLQRNEPELFAALARKVGVPQPPGPGELAGELAGWADVFKSVGSAIATGVSKIGGIAKSVGSFIASPNGVNVLSTLGETYLATKAQKQAVEVQLAAAQAGLPPAPIETTFDPATNTYVPIIQNPATGFSQPLTPQISTQLLAELGTARPGFDWRKWAPWLAVGGLGVVLLFWLASSRE